MEGIVYRLREAVGQEMDRREACREGCGGVEKMKEVGDMDRDSQEGQSTVRWAVCSAAFRRYMPRTAPARAQRKIYATIFSSDSSQRIGERLGYSQARVSQGGTGLQCGCGVR